MHPSTFVFQIRTNELIKSSGKKVSKNMIATITLDIHEVEKILEYMKNEEK